MTHRVACIQMGALGTWEENVNHAVALSEKTDADLIVLPELFAHCRNFKVGEPIPGLTTDIFAQLARKTGSYILMGSILEVDDHDQKFNTSVLIDLSLIHISEPTRRTPISYAVFCLKKKKKNI